MAVTFCVRDRVGGRGVVKARVGKSKIQYSIFTKNMFNTKVDFSLKKVKDIKKLY